MLEFLENLFENINPLTAYLVIFLSAFTENVVPPIPGDTVVILGAYLVGTGRLKFLGVYLATTLGSVAGFITMYAVGKYFGVAFLATPQGKRLFKEKYLERTRIWFGKWGYGVILANRFLSGTRSVISLVAGLFHLRLSLVIILSLLSSMIWNALLISGGLLLGRNWSLLQKWISRYNQFLLVLLVGVVLYFVIRRYFNKRGEETK
jgi:membrane protein DedA with SNARE-associated domain